LLEIESQIFGKSVIHHKNMSIAPEKIFQTSGETSIRSVETFKSKEKINTEKLSEAITRIGALIDLDSQTLVPSIIGRSGRTHGESTVRIQEKKATSKRNI